MRTLLVSLLLLSAPRMVHADYPPLQGPYDERDNHTADAIASSMALFPMIVAGGACGMVMLPADTYWKLTPPADDFATHPGDPLCSYPAAVVGYSSYLVGGFPFFAAQKIAHATHRSLVRGHDAHSSPPRTAI